MTEFWKRKESQYLLFSTYLFLLCFSKVLEYWSFGFTLFSPFYLLHQVFFIWGIIGILRISTRVFLVLSFPILLFEIFSFGHFAIFKIPITEGGLSSVYNSNFLEWLDYGNGTPISGYIFTLIILFVFILNFKFPSNRLPIKLAILFFLPTSLTFGLKLIQLKKLDSAFKQTIIQSRPTKSINLMLTAYHNLSNFSELLNNQNLTNFDLKIESKVKQKHIVIIGESSRRSNWQLFGYQRETNPNLKENKHLILYPNIISGSNVTLFSLTEAFYFRENNDPDGKIITNLLFLLEHNDFKTEWISNQQSISQIDSPIGVLASSASKTLFLNTDQLSISYDQILLKPIEASLSQRKENTLLFVHTMGSHGEYHRRYPPEDNFFLTTDITRKEDINLAMYDNTIRYTDKFLFEVIKLARKYNVNSITYFSDHGETVFEDGVPFPTHGNPNFKRREVEIPFFVWLNPEVSNYEQLKKSLEINSDKPGTLNDFKNFILSLIGFKGEPISQNLAMPNYSSKKRVIYGSDKRRRYFEDLAE